MNEQSCGTCNYFTPDHANTDAGTCWWATKNRVPDINPRLMPTYRTWGEDCPCWEADDPVENVS